MSGRLVTAGRPSRQGVTRNRDQFIVGDLLERSPDAAMRVEAAAHAKARAIVTILIGLRPGNNTDVLEALGLIPTVRALLPAPPIVDFTCQDCDWVPTKLVNPAVALASHRRARHRSVVSW